MEQKEMILKIQIQSCQCKIFQNIVQIILKQQQIYGFVLNMKQLTLMLTLKDYQTLLGNTVAQPAPNEANGILKNATIVVPLKYLSNFWRSLKMPLINCKVELKLRWTNHYALQLVMIILMIILTILFLISRT